jgi:GAF domain-containing protein
MAVESLSQIDPTQTVGEAKGIRRLFKWLFSVHYPYADVLDRQRALVAVVIVVVLGATALIGGVGLRLILGESVLYTVPVGIAMAVVCSVLYIMIQRGRLRWASHGLMVALLTVAFAPELPTSVLKPLFTAFVLPVILAAFLLGTWPAFIAVFISTVMIAIVLYVHLPGFGTGLPAVNPDLVFETAYNFFVLLVTAALASRLSSILEGWARSAQRIARQLEAAEVVSETAATATSLSKLLNVVVERIRDAYGFYHAQVFLLDPERRMARLEASTGKAGEVLLARGHALPVGSQSVVGQCTYRGEPVVINDVLRSTIHRRNELLPLTRAELALPLVAGDRVIGALDVQSTTPNVFQPEDVRSLQAMANQLSSAIERARLLDELQARAAENQRLYEEAQSSLRQFEDLSRRMTREGWSDYLRARRLRGSLGYTLSGQQVQHDAGWTAPMRQAYQSESSVVIRQGQQAHIAALPLRVRGEVIGVLEIERGGNRPWTDDELEMAETLVDRLALAVENARLYEQATLSAEREQLVNRITQTVQQAGSIDDVLQTALAELGSVLGASRGVVQISPKVEQASSEQPDDGA